MSYINQSIIKKGPNQALISESLQNLICNLKDSAFFVLNTLIRYQNIFNVIDPSQQKIADKSGIHRVTTNKQIKYLKQLGLIKQVHYRHRHSSVYVLPDIFYNLEFRKRLSDIIPDFKWTPKIFLLLAVFIAQNNNHKKINTFNENKLHHLYTKQVYKKENSPLPVTGSLERLLTDTSSFNRKQSLTIRKKEPPKMLQSVVEDPRTRNFLLTSSLKFTNEQIDKLAVYELSVVKHAFSRTIGRDLMNPFAFMFKICSEEAGKAAIKKQTAKEPDKKEANPESRREWQRDEIQPIAALELAKRINVMLASDPVAKLAKLVGVETATKYRDRALENLANRPYLVTNEPGEEIAVAYINKYRSNLSKEDKSVDISINGDRKDSM